MDKLRELQWVFQYWLKFDFKKVVLSQVVIKAIWTVHFVKKYIFYIAKVCFFAKFPSIMEDLPPWLTILM